MTKWIPVLVRLDDYAEITNLIAKHEADRNDGEPITPVREVRDLGSLGVVVKPMSYEDEQLANHVPWSLEDLATLAQGKTATTERWSRAMDVCAGAPEKWLPTSEIAKRAGMTTNEWRDAPRKITRHLRAHFPDVPKDENGDAWWPLSVGGSGIPANGGEVWWAITVEMALRWRKVRAGQGVTPPSVDTVTDLVTEGD
jgi:hypothetical protein